MKLLEQECLAEQQNARRLSAAKSGATGPKKPPTLSDRMDKKLDAALKDSFPGSDPVSFLEATPVNEGDRDRTPVGDQPPAPPGKRGRSTR